MKNSLLVTLADKNYFDQAKQLFSSAYFNAGWQGDYMLLVPGKDKNEPGLEWFRKKGILVKALEPLHKNITESISRNETIIKFYLFTPEFKKWNNIIFLDVDIIVRASLDELSKVKGFGAVVDPLKLSGQFFIDSGLISKNYQALLDQFKRKYALKSKSFNTGVLSFNTSLIEEGTLNSLNKLMDEYKNIIKYGDQSILNLFFYNQWENLLPAYNVYVAENRWHLKPIKIKGIIIHSPGPDKLWLPNNYFYQEWKDNLDKADKIDLKNIPTGHQWTHSKIISYSKYLDRRYIVFSPYFYIDKKIGQLGLLLKKYFPQLYRALKGGKNGK